MKKNNRKVKRSKERRVVRQPLSDHPYQAHLDEIRSLVHDHLAEAGITDLCLRSMEFGPVGGCPDGQHLAQKCTTDASGREVCVWVCVPN